MFMRPMTLNAMAPAVLRINRSAAADYLLGMQFVRGLTGISQMSCYREIPAVPS